MELHHLRASASACPPVICWISFLLLHDAELCCSSASHGTSYWASLRCSSLYASFSLAHCSCLVACSQTAAMYLLQTPYHYPSYQFCKGPHWFVRKSPHDTSLLYRHRLLYIVLAAVQVNSYNFTTSTCTFSRKQIVWKSRPKWAALDSVARYYRSLLVASEYGAESQHKVVHFPKENMMLSVNYWANYSETKSRLARRNENEVEVSSNQVLYFNDNRVKSCGITRSHYCTKY